MRVRLLLLPLVALVALGCSSAKDVPRADSTLNCKNANGQSISCDVTLAAAGGFTLSVLSTSCVATNDEIRLVKPVEQVLTADGCNVTQGTSWSFGLAPDAPFPAGTVVNLVMSADQINAPPSLRIDGTQSPWRLIFEDGGDQDYNDVILQLTEVPSAP